MPTLETSTLAGGCFWCLEAVFARLAGVHQVESGYTGGSVADPSYGAVCAGVTGHAEAIRITFDPAVVSFQTLVELFFAFHDPTTLNQQGPDVGTQYRSAIFWHNEAQLATARMVMAQLAADGTFTDPLVTELSPATAWYPAEAYHQEYYRRNPAQAYCAAMIGPKVAKLRSRYAALLKDAPAP
ncbi:MAG: peptide-methionine (S)-S-oxide reductase MsrA [Gemmatimonadota bacterium]|nr:peptide-methionine (S)-S-oxide reductase MsrA [Gemmatimonadota bacterium]